MWAGIDRGITTDRDGKFEIDELAQGQELMLRVSAEGFLGREARGIVVPVEEPLAVQLAVAAAIRGRVVDGGGAPVRAEVFLHDDRAQMVSWLTRTPIVSDEGDGSFELGSLAAGSFDVRARAPGYVQRKPYLVELAEGEVVSGLQVVLEPGGSRLSGRVLNGRGEGVAVYVSVHPRGTNGNPFEGQWPTGWSDAGGHSRSRVSDPARSRSWWTVVTRRLCIWFLVTTRWNSGSRGRT